VSGVYVTAFVPVAYRPAAEAALSPYLLSPNDPGAYTFSAPLVPLAGPSDVAPTHYGCCSRLDTAGGLGDMLTQLAIAIPGSGFSVVLNVRTFRHELHWVAWLATQGLQPRVTGAAL
jgi:hypothetical protein